MKTVIDGDSEELIGCLSSGGTHSTLVACLFTVYIIMFFPCLRLEKVFKSSQCALVHLVGHVLFTDV